MSGLVRGTDQHVEFIDQQPVFIKPCNGAVVGQSGSQFVHAAIVAQVVS